MPGVERTPVRTPVEVAPERFPFGVEFQKALLRLLSEDVNFALALAKYMKPTYFENEVLAWAYAYMERYRTTYNTMPSLTVVLEQTRSLDPKIRPLYTAVIEQVKVSVVRDELWLRDNVLDFVRRNIFVRTFQESRELYNANKSTQAYDLMMQRMDELNKVSFEPIDREWFYEQLPQRQSARMAEDPLTTRVGTGIGWLDGILGGGVGPGELALWIGYAKGGKTTMLTHHGVAATRRCMKNVLHFVFEGSRKQVAARYDTAHTGQLYSDVKAGRMSDKAYQMAMMEYQYLRHKLVLRGFTDRWDYSVTDMHQELMDLKRTHGWEPQLVIIDYGDLITGRDKSYRSETEKQRAAYRDMKSLANRGYAVVTASQARRPEDESILMKPHLLWSSDVADNYDKVRVADFVGSLNQTPDERKSCTMRLFAELCRDNAAQQVITVKADFARMHIEDDPSQAAAFVNGPEPQTPTSNYAPPPTQTRAPIS